MEYTYNNEQYYYVHPPQVPAGGDCGCGGPRMITPSPGGLPPGTGPGPGPFTPGPIPFHPQPGPGPFPPGPGTFPPGPSLFPIGPEEPGPGPSMPVIGPFWPGAGPFWPGPGPFWPGHGPFLPGPGPFFPGSGPFLPGSGSFPFRPVTFPFPFPQGVQQLAPVTVSIDGGRSYAVVNQACSVAYRSGLSIYQALAETGLVQFDDNGQILSVDGIEVGDRIQYQLQLNGRIIPQSLLSFPVQSNDTITLELFIPPFPRVEVNEEAL